MPQAGGSSSLAGNDNDYVIFDGYVYYHLLSITIKL